MAREMKIGNRMIGDGHPAYIIAEIGINHKRRPGYGQGNDHGGQGLRRGRGQTAKTAPRNCAFPKNSAT